MFSALQNIYTYFRGKNETSNDDMDEEFLAQELLQLEIENSESDQYDDANATTPGLSDCFERTGTITYLGDGHGLIDGMMYFNNDYTGHSLFVNDKVRYLAYKSSEDDSPKVIKILQTLGQLWDDEEVNGDEKEHTIKEHSIVGKVDNRDKRIVVLKENNIKFDLDIVHSNIIPVKGDWLELTCKIQWDNESPYDIEAKQVLEVVSIKPLRSRIGEAKVIQWNGKEGYCSGHVYFNKQSCQTGFDPVVGSKVLVEAIESDQGVCTWRALTLVPDGESPIEDAHEIREDEEANSYTIEEEQNLSITKLITLSDVNYRARKSTILEITNNSLVSYTLLKCKLMSGRHASQLVVEPVVNRKMVIHPKQSVKFTLTCRPKVLGNSRELLVLEFYGFQVKRYINISVVDTHMDAGLSPGERDTSERYQRTECDQRSNMKEIQLRRMNQPIVAGIRPVKPPAFVPVKLGAFPIPNRVWGAVLGDSDQTIYSQEFSEIIQRIERAIPCLSAQLTIGNYTDRWHALLYIEEIQGNIHMRNYDMPKAFLIPSESYLRLEIQGLSERRPSLMISDRVFAKDIWDSTVPDYEGYIHDIRGDNIYLKFHAEFHERYTGYDVKLEFHFSRSKYRRCHQGVNLAITHLGPDILFPSRTMKTVPQVNAEKIKNISWFNQNLNPGQMETVKNIIEGVSRPMPYCIFGPPGTGKTITVVETVLQILNVIPDSRILIATPSNSAANILTERLLKYKHKLAGSLIRLIAHYLVNSDNLPDEIKPYCATLDIAREYTAKSKHRKNDDGINLSCRSSFIGRHRVTIGTCSCLGTLAQMELPRGHFTHLVVDEAGQATEPEIMIPMTFIDKDSGQIILAGDPLQLGPIAISKYAEYFDFGRSYLERLLERVPYQKDFEAFGEMGYDKRSITRLTYNYRSVPKVIEQPSEMFYDSCLVPQVSEEEEWVRSLLQNIHDVLPRRNIADRRGGIFMYGMKGVNARAVDSPSWYNPQEATMLMLYTCKLYKRNVTPDQIGVIAPYIAQIKYLRKLFDSTGTPQPKIGTVEEFQGQERNIILLSTVRSSETLLEQDYKFALGFVKNPKRLNVALTRAQVAVVMFGDPHLLSRDVLWRKVINHVVKHGQYVGCDLPANLESAENV